MFDQGRNRVEQALAHELAVTRADGRHRRGQDHPGELLGPGHCRRPTGVADQPLPIRAAGRHPGRRPGTASRRAGRHRFTCRPAKSPDPGQGPPGGGGQQVIAHRFHIQFAGAGVIGGDRERRSRAPQGLHQGVEMEVHPMFESSCPGLHLDDGDRGDGEPRSPDGEVHPTGQFDRSAGQPDPHGHLGAREPGGVEPRPPVDQVNGLTFDFGGQRTPLRHRQVADPGDQIALPVVESQGVHRVLHRIADRPGRHQLPEQRIDEGTAGHRQGGGLGTGWLGPEPRFPVECPGQPVFGDDQWLGGAWSRGSPTAPPVANGSLTKPVLDALSKSGHPVGVGQRAGPTGDPEAVEEGVPGQGGPARGEGGRGPVDRPIRPSGPRGPFSRHRSQPWEQSREWL